MMLQQEGEESEAVCAREPGKAASVVQSHGQCDTSSSLFLRNFQHKRESSALPI